MGYWMIPIRLYTWMTHKRLRDMDFDLWFVMTPDFFGWFMDDDEDGVFRLCQTLEIMADRRHVMPDHQN